MSEDTNMEPSGSIASTSRGAPARAGTSLRNLFEEQKSRTNWSLLDAKGLMAIVHDKDCDRCHEYGRHVLSAARKGELDFPDAELERAINTAWPRWIREVEDRAIRHEGRDYEAL